MMPPRRRAADRAPAPDVPVSPTDAPPALGPVYVHQRDAEDAPRPHRRESDVNVFAKLRPWMPTVLGALAWMATVLRVQGYQGVTPEQRVSAVEDSVRRHGRRIDTLSLTQQRNHGDVLDSLSRIAAFQRMQTRRECLTMRPDDAVTLSIPCDSLLRPYGLRTGERAVTR